MRKCENKDSRGISNTDTLLAQADFKTITHTGKLIRGRDKRESQKEREKSEAWRDSEKVRETGREIEIAERERD